MSSHPGSHIEDAVELALYLKKNDCRPEQVQDFYPTPGTASTVMYYTGINPLDGKKVYTETDYNTRRMQRALLQWSRPENAPLIREALRKCSREDLIGNGNNCLVPNDHGYSGYRKPADGKSDKPADNKTVRHENDKNFEKSDKRPGNKNKTGVNNKRYGVKDERRSAKNTQFNIKDKHGSDFKRSNNKTDKKDINKKGRH
jgi:hypothetical protein